MSHPPIELTKLEPQFLRYVVAEDGSISHHHVDNIGEAQGIIFVCPGCLYRNKMVRAGVHSIICWSESRGVPKSARPGPGRWSLKGKGYADLTLDGDRGRSRSVKTDCWHGYITEGVATDAG